MEAVDVRRFVWHQLMTRDVPGAKKFYSKLVGWKTMLRLRSVAHRGHADVGLVAGHRRYSGDLPRDVPSHWVQHIGTRDVDGTAGRRGSRRRLGDESTVGHAGRGSLRLAQRPAGRAVRHHRPRECAGRVRRPAAAGYVFVASSSRPPTMKPPSRSTARCPAGTPCSAWTWVPVGLPDLWTKRCAAWRYLYQAGCVAGSSKLTMPCECRQGVCLATSGGATEMVAPMDVPGGGRIASVSDPSGAAFAVHSIAEVAAASASPAAKPKPKAKAKSAPEPKAKAKAAPKPKAKAKAKAKAKVKAKSKPAKKPAAKKKVVRKAAKKVAKKAARKPAKKKSKSSRRKK